MPIPRGTRLLVSPSSETLLLEQDLEYAMAARLTGVADDGSTAQVPAALPERTLSINPDATARALVLLVGLTLLLAGLTRLLNITGARRLVTALSPSARPSRCLASFSAPCWAITPGAACASTASGSR